MYKTMEQIKKEYDGHWVFLVNCTQGEHHSITGGTVAIATKERAEVFAGWSKFAEDKHGPTLIFYAGEPPPRLGMMICT